MSTPTPPPSPPGLPPPPPPPPYPQAGWPTGAPAAKESSGMATAALVCGIVGLVMFALAVPSIVALVLGLVAASRAKRSGAPGGGLGRARAGWIMGVIGVSGFVAVVLVAALTDGFGDDRVDVFDLDAGDCVDLPDDLAQTEVRTLEAFDCALPHDAEVFLVDDVTIGGESYPGEALVTAYVQSQCTGEAFEDYIGRSSLESELDVYLLYPIERIWEPAGDREFVCLARTIDGTPLTGSVEGSGR